MQLWKVYEKNLANNCLMFIKSKQWFYHVSNPKESFYIERVQTLANLYCLKIYRENISLISIVNYLCLQLLSKSIKTTLRQYTKDYEKLGPFHDIHLITNVELWCGQLNKVSIKEALVIIQDKLVNEPCLIKCASNNLLAILTFYLQGMVWISLAMKELKSILVYKYTIFYTKEIYFISDRVYTWGRL